MGEKLRKTGIDTIGDAPWGTHFCQFYKTKEDLTDILVPYFKAGLENNEFCMWVTSEPLRVGDAKRALKRAVKELDDYINKGQIEILDRSQWYTKSGKFDAGTVLKGWIEKEKEAVKRGFDGLRLTGNTLWLGKKDWRKFADYEAVVNHIIRKHRALVVCTYSLDKCEASEVIDVVSNHQFTVIKREGQWKLIENTELKQAKEALRQNESYNFVLFEYNPIETIVVDREGRVIRANMAKRKSGDRLPNPGDLMYKDYAGKHETDMYIELMECIRSGKSRNFPELKYKDKFIDISIAPFPEGAIITSQDITKRKLAEEEREKLQARLIQSEKMAGVGTLASGIAHEFNNLLHIMRGHTEFAQQTKKPEDMQEALDIVINTSDKAAKIVGDLSAFSRHDTPKKELYDIKELLESVLSLTEIQLKKHNIKLVRKYGKTSKLKVNRGEIQQVFLNIVTNARDSMLPRGGRLEINVKEVNKNVEVSFHDTGKGIKKEYLTQVFEPFYTTKGAVGGNPEIPGTGLGLSVSYGIVKRHEGTIEAESQAGKGTTFIVKLPVKGK